MTELQHEKHNRISTEIAQKIFVEFPKIEERLVVLESITNGIICTMTKSQEARKKILEIFIDGIKCRILGEKGEAAE